MNTWNHKQRLTPGRLTILAAAIASALAVGQSSAVLADPMSSSNTDTVTLLTNPVDNTLSGGDNGFQNTGNGNVGTLNNSGTISGNHQGIYNTGNITSLNNLNGGTLSGNWEGIHNDANATVGALNNSGIISGYYDGIVNRGTITALSNAVTGSISVGSDNGIGINNMGVVSTLSNSGIISAGINSHGIFNAGSIDTLNNSGTISGGSGGIYNRGATSSYPQNHTPIGTLSNSGIISGNVDGIYNGDTITSLSNTGRGTIFGGLYGIYNGGTITSLSNAGGGTISGISIGIWNDGTIGALTNSGLITADGLAIYSTLNATLGTITNSGTIAGTIHNDSSQPLTINGGSGSTFGVLTGSQLDPKTHRYGAGSDNIGQITNANSNLIFAAGNQLLNDNIVVNDYVNVNDNIVVVNHTVSNSGTTLQVNNTIGIDGNYSQSTNASLILGVGSNAVTTGDINTDAGYGRLQVSGSANVQTGSSIGLKQLGTYGFAQGQRYVVIQANSTGTDSTHTNYNASTLHYTAAGYNVAGSSVVDNKAGTTDLLLTLGSAIPVITPVTPTPPSTAPINQATSTGGNATLAGLFNYGGYNAGLMNLFNAAAALDSSAAGNRAGAQLSPTATLSAATQASTASTVQVMNVTTAHIDGLRTAQNGNNGSGVATGESASSTGLWGQGFGGSSRLGERDDVAGYHAHYSGMLLGADAALNDSWRAGGLFSYTDTTVNNDGSNAGSSADVKSYGLFGYATYTGNPWYVDLSLGAVQQQYDTTREVNFTGFSGTAKGQHDGMQYIASVLAGYPIDLGSKMANTVLTPIAGLTYSTLRQDSYTEKDGGGAALHVSADNIGSLKSDLGTKLERSFGTPYGNVVPSAQLTWRHEYRDNGLQSVANYAADTSGATSFTTTGAKAVADTGVMALGVTLVRSQNLSIGAKYTLEAASGYAANTGDVQVRWDF